ncbi:hypothetical protein [Brucella anthropi]|uniref:hypothetical protein n=1 Tax=Brucella anthropi TaxID=529 RepID=UPI002165C34D|nr:hypothetical protein [Brucella anthropi]UVV66513.1 hypothetical protein NW321_08440 [Brucella anthropi]
MAYQDQFYTVGTVTLTGGSTAVTGAGTGWETALIVGGVFYAGGGAYPIQSVSSETELTLAIPYVGVDAAGVGYAIDRQRAAAISNIAMNDRLAQIIREISIGNIEELNALELVANKVLTTNAAGHLSQEALGTLGRALLALASGTSAQYVQGDGTLQAKTGLPVSTAQQAALNGKLSLSGGTVEGAVAVRGVLASKGAHSASAGAPFFNVLNVGNNIDWTWYLAGWNDPGILFSYTPSGSWVSTPLTMKGATGAVIVQGAFSAGSKSFEIDHPSDPFNKDLIFMSTEAPKAGVEFWGTVRLIAGVAEVDIDAASNLTPGTFAALTQRAVPLAPNNLDGETTVRSSRIVNGKFTIFASDPNCTDEVSWHVKAERADAFIKSCEFCDPETGVLIPEREKENA